MKTDNSDASRSGRITAIESKRLLAFFLMAFGFTWIYDNTNGSLLAMLLTHTLFNLAMFTFPVHDIRLGYASC